jgi:formate-dependent nitrite reductase cytochrome c552 subunit
MACFVCHANYKGEFVAERHAAANIGCVSCHGDSLAHRNDENNTTPPETMYPADKIDPFCRGCHDAHDIPAKEIVARWKELNLDRSDPDKIVCTDCHGRHRMKVRTVIWDKKTGKLLRTNRGD